MNSDFGFVTAATGKPDYLEMAVDMVLSLRQFHDDPVALLCDANLANLAQQHYASVFDHIIEIKQPLRHALESNFLAADLAPFERGLFLDADILLLASLRPYIEDTREKQVTMMGSYLQAGSGRQHHGIPVDKLLRHFAVDRFFTNHSGMFGYQRESARAFFARSREFWQRLYTPRWRLQGFIGNELGFGLAAATIPVSIMREPFPVIWANEMRKMQPGQAPKPLLHFISAPPPDVLEALMADVRRRRARAGLSARSQAHWLAKARRPRLKGRLVKRVLLEWARAACFRGAGCPAYPSRRGQGLQAEF